MSDSPHLSNLMSRAAHCRPQSSPFEDRVPTFDPLESRCIQELFEAQVTRTPNAPALILEAEEVSYSELNRRANQLAHYLQRLSVGPESLVCICVERSIEGLVGLLGVIKTGGAYVPLDPMYPMERRLVIAQETKAAVILTQAKFAAEFSGSRLEVVRLDTNWREIEKESAANPKSRVRSDNLAYVIYTSGSTGKPKGVMIQQGSLASYTVTASADYALREDDRVLQFASISFDASAEEIFPCLTTGACLVLRTDEMLASAGLFLQRCRDWAITVLDLPTAYWHELTATIASQRLTLPPSLRLVIIGGERALPERLALWHKSVGHDVRLVNTYGPTEATIVATS